VFLATALLGFFLKLNFSSGATRQSAEKNPGTSTPAWEAAAPTRATSYIKGMGDSNGLLTRPKTR